MLSGLIHFFTIHAILENESQVKTISVLLQFADIPPNKTKLQVAANGDIPPDGTFSRPQVGA
jgi:hypothetical protein